MRRLTLNLVRLLLAIATPVALAQLPGQVTFTGDVTAMNASSVKIQLVNCGANHPRVLYQGVYQTTLVQTTWNPTITSGTFSIYVWPNDLITCGGTATTTVYQVTYLQNGVAVGQPETFQVLSTGPNPFNTTAQTPLNALPAAPVAASALPINGGTLTGPLWLSGSPTSALQAATKAYVDNAQAAAESASDPVGSAATAQSNAETWAETSGLAFDNIAREYAVWANNRAIAKGPNCNAAGDFPEFTGTLASISGSTLTAQAAAFSPSTPHSKTIVLPQGGPLIAPAWQANYAYAYQATYTYGGSEYIVYNPAGYTSGATWNQSNVDTNNSAVMGVANYALVSTIVYSSSTAITLDTAPSNIPPAGTAFAGGIDDYSALTTCAQYGIAHFVNMSLGSGNYLVTKHVDAHVPNIQTNGGFWIQGDGKGTAASDGFSSSTVITEALTEPYAAVDMNGDFKGGIEGLTITPLYGAWQNSQATAEILDYMGATGTLQGGQHFVVRDVNSYGANCPGCAGIALPGIDEAYIENSEAHGGLVVGMGLGKSTNVLSGVYPTGPYSIAGVMATYNGGNPGTSIPNPTHEYILHSNFCASYVPSAQLTGSADYVGVDDYSCQNGLGIGGAGIELSTPSTGGVAWNALHIYAWRTENQTDSSQAGTCNTSDAVGCGMIGLNIKSRMLGGDINSCFTTDPYGALVGINNGTNQLVENATFNLVCGSGSSTHYPAYFNITATPYVDNDTFYIATNTDALYTGTMAGTWDYNTFHISNNSSITSSALINALPAGNKGNNAYHGIQDSYSSPVSVGASPLTAFRYGNSQSQPSSPWTQLGQWTMASGNTSNGDTLTINITNGFGYNSGGPTVSDTRIVIRGANGTTIPNLASVSWSLVGRPGGIQNVKVVDCSGSPGTSATNGTWCVWVLGATNDAGVYTVSTSTQTNATDTWTDTSSNTNGGDPSTVSGCSPVSNCVVTSTTASGMARGLDGSVYGTSSLIQTQYGNLNFVPLTNPTGALTGTVYSTGGSIPAGTYSYTYALSADGSTWTNQTTTALSESPTGATSSVLLQLGYYAQLTGANYVMWCRGGYELATTNIYQGAASYLDTLSSPTATACPSSNGTQGAPKINGAAPNSANGLVQSNSSNQITQSTTGNAATATALAATPSQCSSQVATGITASGAANCTANLPNGMTATTQSSGDISTDVATDAFAQNVGSGTPAWLRYLGTGADGSNTTASGNMNGVYYYTSFTVPSGNTVDVNGSYGLTVHATGACVINGTIEANGATVGAKNGNVWAGGGGGGSGGGTAAGTAGTNVYLTISNSANGGTAGAASGGNGGNGSSTSTAQRRPFLAMGGAGDGQYAGGGDGKQGGSSGGAAGYGGGGVTLICASITGAGTIDVSGENGSNAAANNTGAGSAGGGGVIVLSSQAPETFGITFNVAGGTGGSCGSYTGCGTGGNGGSGASFTFSGW